MTPYNTQFLATYNDYTLGPIQQDEALFLYALSKMVRPQIVLEIGCLIGQSLKVWIESGVPFIYAVDAIISDEVKHLQRGQGSNGITCLEQDMKAPIDFYRGVPDLVFVDASHKLEDNQAVVNNLLPVLKPGALFILHDTGHWAKHHVDGDVTGSKKEFLLTFGGKWDEQLQAWVHHPGEKETIEWISKNTKWERVDLWTTAVARYGLTIFQVK